MDEIKEAQALTRGIKNCRDSTLFKGCSPLQLLCNLIGNRPQSATFHTANVVCKAEKDIRTFIDKSEKLKNWIKKIHSLIEVWCKKKLVFAHPLLPFGTVREAHAHCTHLQIAQAHPTDQKFAKECNFCQRSNKLLKL
ncbi:MAG: hypothetical protein HC892_21565 [Saprospiraceae bacterium]|nr:hypothetical protein [Saprospiraceae bacterium]